MRPDLRMQSAADGLPAMPDSSLVLDTRDGLDELIMRAMPSAISQAFQ